MSELDRWETRFSGPGYAFGKEPAAFLKAQAHRLPASGKALSIADGEGRNGVWLAERGLDVLAIDFSPTALQKSRALAAERGVTLATELADVMAWRWPAEAYDVIVAIFIQFVTPAERSTLFDNMKHALKPGGLLLLHGYRPEQLRYRTGGPQEADHMYTRALLEAAFGDMKQIEIFEHDSVVSEGSSHVGMSALIDLVAIK
ncbi:MAG TPA: class I SAM-dependent methyltransferase [Xanthobacteraceae bacterium]|jgi:cyclopropane fatty-acyl-phospholipid synthase-like methyltransferase|nr:class I SAM-dependent methyltransferase [Xanthobacteraceae bacterium]